MFKLFSVILLILFSSNIVYSEGFYNSQNKFNYYVNNPTPEVEVYIKLPTENLVILDANLKYNSEDKFLDFADKIIPAQTPQFVKKISLSEFAGQGPITKDDQVYFKLNVIKQASKTEIETNGDPVEFFIILDEEKPQLISPNSNAVSISELDEEFSFKFSEKISKFEIKDSNGKVILSKPDTTLFFESDYSNTINFQFPSGRLKEGDNLFTIEYYDFAENKVSSEFNFEYRGDDLKMELVSKKDDLNLKYFYDVENPELFENKIYFSENEYDLVVKTNKKANCYFSSSFVSFVEFESILQQSQYSTFSSENNLEHKFSMNGETLIWVACQDLSFPEKVVYLNQVFGEEDRLVNLEKYNLDFSISKFFPEELVSNMPFSVDVFTTQKAVCKFKIGNGNLRSFGNNTEFKRHLQQNVELSEGSYELEVSCYDKIYNVKTESKNVKVDLTSGPRVIGDKEFYVDSTSSPIYLKFSEDAVCGSKNEKISGSEFNATVKLSGEGLEKSFTPSGLEIGENEYYVFCIKDGQMITNEIGIIFDPNQPRLENLKFVNNGAESEYLSDKYKIKFGVDYTSKIPAKEYQVQVIYSNFTETKNYSKSSGVFSGDLSNANKFKITAINVLGKSSNTLEKLIKFDMDKPILAFSTILDNKVITCIDSGSGCNKIYYGFSQTQLDCNANTLYTLNQEIDVSENSYICARATDFVGNENKIQESLVGDDFDFSGSFDDFEKDNPVTDLDNKSSSTDIDDKDDKGSNNNVDDNPFTQDPTDGNTKTESNGLVIAAAIIVLLGSLGGGGYYAYREGYLDTQLEKFGIFRDTKPTVGGVKSSGNIYSPISKDSSFGLGKEKVKKSNNKKTGYDRNLNKLNSFIDETLNKGNDVFDSFGSSSKGKNKNYEDTLIKNTKPKKKVSQEFSLKSKGSGLGLDKDDASIEREAEEFENYFKKKNIKNTDKKEK